jgi:hypothetical protein
LSMSSDESASTLFEGAARLALNKYKHLPKAREVVDECLRQHRWAVERGGRLILSPQHLSQVSRAPDETIISICEHLHLNQVVSAVVRVYCPNACVGDNDVAFEITHLEALSSVTDEATECPVCGGHHALDDWLTEVIFSGITTGEAPLPFVPRRRGVDDTTVQHPDACPAEEYSPAARDAVSVTGPSRHSSLIGAASLLVANERPSDGHHPVLPRLDEQGAVLFDRFDPAGAVISSTLVSPPPDGQSVPPVESAPLRLPGAVIERLCAVMTAAYDEPALTCLLRFKLDKVFDELTSREGFGHRCFELVSRAEREGWLSKFVWLLCHNRDNGNSSLAAFWVDNAQHFSPRPPLPA